MTPSTLKLIRRLVRPYVMALGLQSADGGPHLQGIASDGSLVTWGSVEEALQWSNMQYWQQHGNRRAVA